MPAPADREKALDTALAQIDRQFGKGSVMRLGDDVRRIIIGKEVLDGGEAGLGGSLEPFQERSLGEHHRQIGGKFWHRLILSLAFRAVEAR